MGVKTVDRIEKPCKLRPHLGQIADQAVIEQSIKTMPNYFSDYDTTVHFVTEETLKAEHNKMPHGGFVIRSGKTGKSDNLRKN